MSDRAPRARKSKNTSENRGESSMRGEAMRWFRDRATYQYSARIRGLTANEIVVWIEKAPAEGHILSDFRLRAHDLIEMGKMSKEHWAKHIAKADKETFEKYVERETDVSHLNAIIEAIGVNGKSNERIGYVNRRKAEL